MTDKTTTPDIWDNMFSPEIFTDGALSFHLNNGVVRMVFASVRAPQNIDAPGAPVPVVVARITTPVAAAQELVLGLNDFLEKYGLSPTAAATAGKTKQ